MHFNRPSSLQPGFSLLEVLVTLVILAFGLLGLAGLQAHVQVSETESFQRAQAVLLVQDMANRLSANRSNAASYLTTGGTPIGTGDSQPTDCSALTGVALDQCEWSNELKGAAENKTAAGQSTSLGAMKDARGCIDLVAGGSPSTPVYLVSVAWQGMAEFQASTLACGANLYGADGYRRAMAISVPVACMTC